MTPAEFIKKWSAYQGKESSAYQEHFNDICHLIGQTNPAAASGESMFVSQCCKGDGELS